MTGVICPKCQLAYVPSASPSDYRGCPRCEDMLPLPIPRMRETYTFATLEVSAAAYDEIAAKLREAGYDHAFVPARTEIEGVQREREQAIDMHGIGLIRAEVVSTTEEKPL